MAEVRQRRISTGGDGELAPATRRSHQRKTCWKPFALALAVAVTVAITIGYIMIGGGATKYPWPVPHVFTRDELAAFTGANGNLILLSILGHVYDVSAAPDYYGPEGSYRFFSGKDASRSFIDGCFNDACFDPEKALTGMTPKQLEALVEWKSFYDKEDKYIFVGTLAGWVQGELAPDPPSTT